MYEDPIFLNHDRVDQDLKKCPFVDKWLNLHYTQTLQHLLMHMNIYK